MNSTGTCDHSGVALIWLQSFEPVTARHYCIEQHAVWNRDFEALQGFRSVACRENIVAFQNQGIAKHVQCFRGVVNDEDDWLCRGVHWWFGSASIV